MIREMRENGMSISGIARTMGISRATVRKYLSMEKPAKYSRKGRRSIIAPYTAYVRDRIDRYNLSAVRIYEELKEKGYPGSYTTVKDLCRNIRRQRSIMAVYRYETEPGKQSQVDFGEFGYIDLDGKKRKLYAFSIILGYSRMRYAEYTTDISTENVIKMHMNAFNYFGGFTDTILYDNMKQVVIERKINASESTFNMKFMDFADYYGIVVRLCYPYRPQTKGKIENTIKYLRYNFFNGRTFSALNDINSQCMEWLNKVNSQVHGTTHEIPVERLPKEKLNELPAVPSYMERREEARKVSRECYVSYKGNRYSVPWKYAGRECSVIEDSGKVMIEIDSATVADHEIMAGTGRISRKKEHFDGLLKAIREENHALYSQIVEKRDLGKYDEVS